MALRARRFCSDPGLDSNSTPACIDRMRTSAGTEPSARSASSGLDALAAPALFFPARPHSETARKAIRMPLISNTAG